MKILLTNYKLTGSIKCSKYPNLIGFESSVNGITYNSDICVTNINFFRIVPKEINGTKNYQPIINILNQYYSSPFCLDINTENKNCNCKESNFLYFKDKYLEPDPTKRGFYIEVLAIPPYNMVPDSLGSVYVINVDYEVAWVFDTLNKDLYLVSLCNICNLYTKS